MSLRGAMLIDFTGAIKPGGHDSFNDAVVKLIRSGDHKTVVIVDRGSCLQVSQPHLVTDHINLTGTNPLCGPNDPCGERFPVVNEIYHNTTGDETIDKLPRGVAAGLKTGVVPRDEEMVKLKSLGADFCCYNLVPAMIVAAHAGLKVIGIVVPDGKVDANVTARLRGE